MKMEKKKWIVVFWICTPSFNAYSRFEVTSSRSVENNLLVQALDALKPEIWEEIAKNYNDSVCAFNVCSFSDPIAKPRTQTFSEIKTKLFKIIEKSQLPQQTIDGIKIRPFKIGRKNLPWTLEEDEILKNHALQRGNNEWEQCAKTLSESGKKRTPKECYGRYTYHLSPRNHGPWTKVEDKLLKEKYNEFKNEWEKVALFFRGRSPLQLKKRYRRLTGMNFPAREWYSHGILTQPHNSDYSEDEEELTTFP